MSNQEKLADMILVNAFNDELEKIALGRTTKIGLSGEFTATPAGYHRMPNGEIMADKDHVDEGKPGRKQKSAPRKTVMARTSRAPKPTNI